MNKFMKMMPVVLFATMAFTTVSCGDDNDDPSTPGDGQTKAEAVDPKTVFTQGLPTKVGDMNITTNAKGQVTKITDDDWITVFDYTGAASRAVSITTDYDMTMKVTKEGSEKYQILYLKLNDNGYVEYAYEIDHSQDGPNSAWRDDVDEWWFTYNTDGQLATMKRTEGNNEVTTITYTNGDITKVEMKSDPDPKNPNDRDEMLCTIAYTNATHTTPIVNKSGIMLFDDSFRIDMDEMAPAYFAGLLGKGTAHLPLSASEDGEYNYSFAWTLNQNDMPTKFVSTLKTQWNTETHEVSFNW